MAESAVSSVLARLAVFLADEHKLAKELEESITSLQNKFEWIRCFLKDADHQRREQKSEFVLVWVKQIRDVAYDVEDVLDEYLLNVELQQQWHAGWVAFFRSLIGFVTQICTRQDLRQRIKQINRRLDEIKANKDMFNLDNTASSLSSIGPDLLRRNELEDNLVGFDEDAKTLIERLIDPKVSQRTVISVVGMGGSGKTTLAAKVYNDEKIKNGFGCRAWVSVSHTYKIRDVVERILRKVMRLDRKETENMDVQDVVQKLSEHLEDKTYLVVIDDIWDATAWDSIKVALPKNQKGSRVLLTTRHGHVAQHADPDTCAHNLNLLGRDDTWHLFSKKAFQNAHCPGDLKPLQDAIVDKCGGLPLATVVLGGILRKKDPSYDQWNKVLQHLRVELRREDRTFKILALSYDVLPHYLKPCFLYFAAYPEDSEIEAQTLMRLWIAEGFMRPEHGQTMEDLAEDSLKELIERCMILVAKKNEDGSIEEVRIHDLFLELARSEAKEVNFFFTPGNGNVLPSPMVRRLSLSAGYTERVFQSWWTPKLRTVQGSLKQIELSSSSFLKSKLLRVIDLQWVHGLEFLPEDIGSMALLTYLGLRHSSIKKLPSSMGNLRNLQTLDIRDTEISEIRSTVWKIPTLRHVLVDDIFFTSYPKISYCLNDLQTLEGVRYGSWVRDDILKKVPNLRHLSLYGIKSSEEKAQLKSLEILEFLIVLRLKGDSLPAEVFISSKHRHLRTLYLSGRVNLIPQGIQIPPSLRTLHLERSGLRANWITLIAKLPNLQYLALCYNAYSETALVCPSSGFPRLTSLKLHYLDVLEELEVQDRALPCLQKLCISVCKKISMLPAGLKHITTLQTLELCGMPTINTRIKAETGDDYPKIQHVLNVVTKEY